MPDNNEVMLSLKNATKRYPGVIAMDDVSLDFFKGEVHALLGENGAGKTTLIKAITGALQIDEGEIIFNGVSYNNLTTSQTQKLGISAVYQERNLVTQLTVANNIFLGDYLTKRGFLDDRTMNAKAREVLAELGFDVDPTIPATMLSEAQKQILEIGRALTRDLKLIIFDEPTSSLMISEANRLFGIIKSLSERGITVIYITHRIEEIFRIADRVTVMRDGRLVDTMRIVDTDRRRCINMMVGRELVEHYPRTKRESLGEIALEVKNLSGDKFRNISFSVREGEILGFSGLIGAGRTETARGVFGADPVYKGEIFVRGKKVINRTPTDGIRNRIGYIPEERKAQGLFMNDSIKHNVSIAAISRFSRWGIINNVAEFNISDEYGKKMRVKAPSFEEVVFNLSGGNQQKVLVAKWLATQCDIIFLDEPTRGIDVGARHEIYELMTAMADEGVAVILISSDMVEIIGMSDRVIVFYEGEIMGELPREDVTQQRIMELASGYRPQSSVAG